MNLQMTLKMAGLNRNTYNTIDRRTGLPFMKRRLLSTAGHDRYTLVHATALACMLEFQSAGLELSRACSATNEFLDVIDGVVFGDIADGNPKPATSWLTVINYADGSWGWASGKENADTFGDGVVTSKVSVNVLGVWEKMSTRVGSLNADESALSDTFEAEPVMRNGLSS